MAGRPSTSQLGAVLQETGGLRGSMGKVREIGPYSLEYGTPSKIAAPLHFGATILPKKSKYLALPYPGVKGRPRDYTGAFFVGKTLWGRKPGESEVQRLFFLKSKVVLPARPFMTITKKTIEDMMVLTLDYVVGIK
jgi:phage gpG-like protein